VGTIALLVRVALACVFAVSGIAKLTDRDGTRQAVAGFGVPSRLVPVVALGIAPVELVTAVLLPFGRTAPLGLVLAAVLLIGFTGAVLLALRTGRTIDCHCFGRLGGADISGRTVVRNVVLGALTLIGLVGLGADSANRAVAVLGGILLAAVVITVEGLAGRAARQRRERENEAAFDLAMAENAHGGDMVADFRLPALGGGERTLADLLDGGRPLLILFMMPGCGPCKSMRPAVARWADTYPDRLRVAVISRYSMAANLDTYGDAPTLDVLVDEEAEVAKGFGVVGTPSAVLIGPDGRLQGGVASGERLVRRLLAAALSGEAPDLTSTLEESGEPADSIDLDSVPAPRQTVTTHTADGVTVLVDEESGAGATLDDIGAIVWSVLDGSGSLREIVDDLADAFEAPAEVVGPDVVTMVRSLGRAGMLVGIAAEPTSDEVDPVTEPAAAG
jgi:thiol-disulfide isomerase/thioredoxin